MSGVGSGIARSESRSYGTTASWPGLSRPSTPFSLKACKKDVDARDKRGHDGRGGSISSEHALQSDLAEIDTDAEPRLDGFRCPALRLDLDRVGAGILIESIEFEVAVIVARGLCDHCAGFYQPDVSA